MQHTPIETLRAMAEMMDTPRLAELVRVKRERKRALAGHIQGNSGLMKENNRLNRELRVLEPILKNRQMKLEGF